MKYIIIHIIKVYQKTFGLLFRGSCKFSPTCSQYMLLAIKKHGVIMGGIKGMRRLGRCHPYSKSFGIDEV